MAIDLENVSRRLEAVREALGLTKAEMAQALGLDASSYSKIIQQTKPLKAEHAFSLAERYGIPMDFIYRGRLNDIPANLAAILRPN